MSARALFDEAERAALVDLRRDLHRHPELSWQEARTQDVLERFLRAHGIDDVRRVARTGLVARVPGRDPRAPAVALRGDIDALPISEATGLDYASVHEGVMHACGHDVHAAWAAGAALLLAKRPRSRRGAGGAAARRGDGRRGEGGARERRARRRRGDLRGPRRPAL